MATMSIISMMPILLLTTVLSAWEVIGAPAAAEVKQFPDFDGPLLSKHYAGYITIGDEDTKQHLYYYFATSERNPTEDPLTIWINGGPACSGPFKIEDRSVLVKERRKVERNPYSWTKVTNILFVDYPAGVGYSYAERAENQNSDDLKAVPDLYEFVLKWFSEYPELLPNPLYFAGCSYSGVFVPALVQEVAKGIEDGRKPTINLKGYSMGNVALDVEIQNNARVPYAHRMGFISDELYEDLSRSCSGKYWNNSHPDCLKNLEIYHTHTGDINKEHILCLPCHQKMGKLMEEDEYDSVRSYRSLYGDNDHSIFCHNYEVHPANLFNSVTARQYLHAMPIEAIGLWKRCACHLWNERIILNLTPYHLNLTMKGYRVIFYSGDHDMIIPYTGTLEMIKGFNYSVLEKWHPWYVDEQIAGYTMRFDHNLLFATIKGAGHTVWEYMPRESLAFYERWTSGAESL